MSNDIKLNSQIPQANDLFDAMMHELGYLADSWRETKDETYIHRYQILCRALLNMGWDDELDFEMLLPEEYMPQEYFARYQAD